MTKRQITNQLMHQICSHQLTQCPRQRSLFSPLSTKTLPNEWKCASSISKIFYCFSTRTGIGAASCSKNSITMKLNSYREKNSLSVYVALSPLSQDIQIIVEREDQSSFQILRAKRVREQRRSRISAISSYGKLPPMQLYNYPKE